MSPMCHSHRKALCMWKDDGQQYPLLARKGFLWQTMWASPQMRIPSMRTAVPCWCVCVMYNELRKTAQAVVGARFVNSQRIVLIKSRRF